MSYQPCDQFAADALSVRREIEVTTGVVVRLNLTRIEAMVEIVEALLLEGVVTAHDEIVEIVLNNDTFQDDIEYTAYKRWLDKIFERRHRLQGQEA